MQKLRSLFAELVRRKVFRILGAYVVLVWLLAQGVAALHGAVGLPEWSVTAFLITGVALLPLIAVLAWKYNLVAPQIVRDSKDMQAANPGHKYAARRHDAIEAGVLQLRWRSADDVTQEKRTGRIMSLGRETGNDVELDDPRISRHHAVLWAERGNWYVHDLGSANGTLLNGEAIDGSTQLPTTCELQLHPEAPVVRVVVVKASETVMHVPAAPAPKAASPSAKTALLDSGEAS